MSEQVEIIEAEFTETSDEVTDLIIIKQLPEFEQGFIKANAEITKRLDLLKDLDISEESKSHVKKIKAELNKELAAFEARRKEVKKRINEPYKELEVMYKGYIAEPYEKAIGELGDKVAFIENKQLEGKHKEILEYFTELNSQHKLGQSLAFP